MATWEKQSRCPTAENSGDWTNRIDAPIAQFLDRLRFLATFMGRVKDNGSAWFSTVDPKPRTSEEVVEALFRERLERSLNESVSPVAQHKQVWSSLTYDERDLHVDAETEVFTWMAREAGLRCRTDQPMVCLMDVQRSLWASCEKHLPDDMVEILDLLHVTSYLWDAAYLFHSEGSAEATAFVRDRALRILRGEVGYVIGGLRQWRPNGACPNRSKRNWLRFATTSIGTVIECVMANTWLPASRLPVA